MKTNITTPTPILPPVYFPALDGLRAIAALFVFVHHVELYRLILGFPTLFANPLFQSILEQLGLQGVGIFFVLSGFLITTNLLKEKTNTGTIQIQNFYWRRILRIWPLYGIVVILGFFVMPLIGYPSVFHVKPEPYFWIKVGLMIFLLPNIVLSVFGVVFPIAPLWSVGIEQQFYLFWPHGIRRFNKSLPSMLIFFVAICVLLKVVGEIGQSWSQVNNSHSTLLFKAFTEAIRFDSLALGGLSAYLLQTRHTFLQSIYRRDIQFSTGAIILTFYLLNPKLHALHDVVYGSLYSILILNMAGNQKTFFKPTHPVLISWGRISYGFYVFHTPILFGVLFALKSFSLAPWFGVVVYLLGLGGTWGIATLSYRLLELPLLGLKTRFSVRVV